MRDDGRLTTALTALGVSWLERGHPAQAVPLLERALRVGEGAPLEPSLRGQIRFSLARALAETHAPPARIAALATDAGTAYEANPRYAAHKAQVETWLEGVRHGAAKRGPRDTRTDHH